MSTKKSDIYEEAREFHKTHKGKIEVALKAPIKDRHDLSVAYSPGVAGVSRAIAEHPEAVREYTVKGNMVAIVSDGTAVLGLGDVGPHAAIPVMEGKAALFKEFAGVDAFPICLDTKDPEEIVRIVKAIAPVFGGVNLEDISAPRCFEIEERLQKELPIPVMHDDQHGTAVVVLAGLINALKLRGSKKEEARVVINGAGAAGVAIAKILLAYGFAHVVVSDSKGAIYGGRGDLNTEKEKLATMTNLACRVDVDDPRCSVGTLADIIKGADVFIGVSKAGVLTPEMVESMAERPIIFALANPEPEIMPDRAKEAGAYVVATGRSDFPNQVNNVLAFPGLFRGMLDLAAKRSGAQFTDEIFTRAAEAIAAHVKNPTPETIIPDPFDRAVAEKVARAVGE